MLLSDLHPRRFFLDTWRRIDEESEQLRAADGGRRNMGTVLYVYAIAAICLTLSDLDYLGGEAGTRAFLNFIDAPGSRFEHPILWFFVGWLKPVTGTIGASHFGELVELGYWTAVKVFFYLIVPLVAIAVHPSLRFHQMGLGTRGFRSHLALYGILFLPVLAAVVMVSFTDEFSTYYPFYTQSTRSAFDFWAWETMYILQFFSLEFFFRGFLLQPMKREMGSAAIMAMVLPYVMIHFGKPFAECMGAVVAGTVLGTLALGTRSIWAGFLIHVSVALSMDIAANLQNKGISWLETLLIF